MFSCITYQGHDLADGALNMQSFASLDTNHVALACQRREQDVGAIGFKDLANFVETGKQDAVNFGRRNGDILHIQADAGNSLMKLLLGKFDGLRALARDEDVCRVTATCSRRAVSVHLGERRREVDGSASRRLNELDVLSVAAAHELVNRQVKLGGIDNSAELQCG